MVQASLVFGKISSDEICPDISMFPDLRRSEVPYEDMRFNTFCKMIVPFHSLSMVNA